MELQHKLYGDLTKTALPKTQEAGKVSYYDEMLADIEAVSNKIGELADKKNLDYLAEIAEAEAEIAKKAADKFLLIEKAKWDAVRAIDKYNRTELLITLKKTTQAERDAAAERVKVAAAASMVLSSQERKAYAKSLEGAEEALSEFQAFGEQVANTLANSMTQTFRSWMNGAMDFKDVMGDVLKDILAQMMKVFVVQKTLGYMFPGASTSPTVNVAGQMADGGITRRGGSYLVGEKGPEIVTLPGNANVTPNGGSTAPSIQVNNYGSDKVSVDTTGDTIKITVAAVTDQIVRGGAVSNAMQATYGLKRR